jgi:hypothetical protein
MACRRSRSVLASGGTPGCRRGTCPPWTGAWTGCQGTPSTASAVCAIVGGISAAQAFAGPERTYGKEKVCGSIDGASTELRHRTPSELPHHPASSGRGYANLTFRPRSIRPRSGAVSQLYHHPGDLVPGDLVPGGQRVRVVGAQHPQPGGQDSWASRYGTALAQRSRSSPDASGAVRIG